MSPWLQQLLFTVVPALAAAYLLRPVIAGTFLRALTVAVIVTAIATSGALLMGHVDPLLTRDAVTSLVIGFVISLFAAWVGKIRHT